MTTIASLSARLAAVHQSLRDAVQQTSITWARHAERIAEHERRHEQCAAERDEWRRRAEAAEARLAVEAAKEAPGEQLAVRRAWQEIEAALVELDTGISELAREP